MNLEILGIIASIIGLSGFIPQIIRGYKLKRLEDLSYFSLFFGLTAMTLWLIYGINKRSVSLIFGNIVGIMFTLIIVGLKYHYSKLLRK